VKISLSLVLLLFGLSLFLLSFFCFFVLARVDTVISVSFDLKPGEKYEPYEQGTYHHTTVFSKSALIGEVVVEGGTINFTAWGYNTDHLRSIFIDQDYAFLIDPADDIYLFTFDNTIGDASSSVQFTLKEKWMDLLSLIASSAIAFTLALAGTVLIILRRRKHVSQDSFIL